MKDEQRRENLLNYTALGLYVAGLSMLLVCILTHDWMFGRVETVSLLGTGGLQIREGLWTTCHYMWVGDDFETLHCEPETGLNDSAPACALQPEGPTNADMNVRLRASQAFGVITPVVSFPILLHSIAVVTGKLQLVRTRFTSLATFLLCAVCFSVTVATYFTASKMCKNTFCENMQRVAKETFSMEPISANCHPSWSLWLGLGGLIAWLLSAAALFVLEHLRLAQARLGYESLSAGVQ